MNYLTYIKENWIEAILCIAMSSALSSTLLEGFHVPAFESGNPGLIIGTVSIVTVILYAFSYNRKSITFGIPIVLVMIILFMVILSGTTPTTLFADSEENTALILIVIIPIAIILFLMSRKRITLILASIVSCILCGAIQFLYLQNHIAQAIVFLAACATMLMLRTARNVQGQTSEGQNQGFLRHSPEVAMGIGLSSVSLILACAVFFLIIAPLNPPTHELKLITEYYSLEEVHVSGLTDLLHKRNQDISSSQTSSTTDKSNQTDQTTQKSQGQASPSPNGEDQELGAGSASNNTGDPAKAIRYFQDNWSLYVLILVALMAIYAATILIRRRIRRIHLERLADLTAQEEVASLYRYVCRGFERAKICKRGPLTPAELAASISETTRRFEGEDMPTDFGTITAIFSKTVYGTETPSSEDLDSLRNYCRAFPAHMMHFAGRIRYIRLFFLV